MHTVTVNTTTAKVPSFNKQTAFLIDSGAAIHVCPRTSFPDAPLQKIREQLRIQTASGQALHVYGLKQVQLRQGDMFFPADSVVTDVQQPILSVVQLMKVGISVNLGTSIGEYRSPVTG